MSESKESLIDKLKNTIPGEVDDKIIDEAVNVVEGTSNAVSDAGGNVSDKVNAATNYIKSAIPGTLDDSVIDKIKGVFSESDRNDYHKE